MAANDAPGNARSNASTPCTKSRWSYSNSAVAGVGAPSVNSKRPEATLDLVWGRDRRQRLFAHSRALSVMLDCSSNSASW